MEGIDPVSQFAELYENSRQAVYRSIRAIVFDHAAAQDLTQEAFERAYKARFNYKSTGSPEAWLQRIAINLAISYWRRQKIARLLVPRLFEAPDESAIERAEARHLVEVALRALSPKLRAVVVLHFYHRFSRPEIAGILDIPQGTVSSRLTTALKIMNRAVMTSDQTAASKRLTSKTVNEKA